MAIEFDKKVKCGAEFVALRMIDSSDNLKVGSIYVPSQVAGNERLAHYIVEDIGSVASKEYGVNVGDYVMCDRLASFAHTRPVALMRYNNIICKTNKDKSEFFPLKNMVFVSPDKKEATQNLGGVYVPESYDKKLNLGTIDKINKAEGVECEFDVGDHVMLVRGGDIVNIGDKILFIYKLDMLICKILA